MNHNIVKYLITIGVTVITIAGSKVKSIAVSQVFDRLRSKINNLNVKRKARKAIGTNCVGATKVDFGESHSQQLNI